MIAPDRYTVRRVVNNLVDALISEGVSKEDILDIIGDLFDSDMEYFDIEWLKND